MSRIFTLRSYIAEVLHFATLVSLTAGCGSDNKAADTPGGAAIPASAGQNTEEPAVSLIVESPAGLPACLPLKTGNLAYVKSESQFYACEGTTWSKIDIKGAKGDPGAKGDSGAKGDAGSKGDTGEAGAATSFKIVESLVALGDGTNLCTKFEGVSCWLEYAMVDIFDNGYWQLCYAFNYSILRDGDTDISDNEGCVIDPAASRNGIAWRLHRFVFRPGSSGGDLYLSIDKDHKNAKLTHDSNNNSKPDPDDSTVGSFPFSKINNRP